MTMTDGERAIVAQLKNIARALGVDPDAETSFADTVKRFAEVPGFPNPANGGYTGRSNETILPAMSPDYTIPKSVYEKLIPTESTNTVWERLMRSSGEGDHLLNPDADHTGEDVE